MNKNYGLEYKEGPERIQFLKDNCDVVENKGYMKQFSPEKVIELKETLAEISIKINDKELEIADLKKDWKKELDPLKEEKQICLKGIKERAELVDEICYTFVEHEEKMVCSYNSEGTLISFRQAMPKDLQGTIFQMERTGTND